MAKGQLTPRRDAARRFHIERLKMYFIYYTKKYTFNCENSDTLRCAALHHETTRGAARRIATQRWRTACKSVVDGMICRRASQRREVSRGCGLCSAKSKPRRVLSHLGVSWPLVTSSVCCLCSNNITQRHLFLNLVKLVLCKTDNKSTAARKNIVINFVILNTQ
jgi:hypothetical protein